MRTLRCSLGGVVAWTLLVTTMAIATDDVVAPTQCRPNIVGGEDCTDARGYPLSSSRRNIFGGRDTAFREGGTASSRPNILGGFDESTPYGIVRSRPNILGGMDYELPDGRRLHSRPNIVGGWNIEAGEGRVLSCRPNIFGGEDCR